MIRHITITLSDFYSLKGRIGRIDFVIGLLVTSLSMAAIHFLSRGYLLELNDINAYLGFNALLQFVGLSLATPFYVKRFHDLNSSGYWVIVYWAAFPFSITVSYSIELITGLQINPFNEFILFIGVIGLLVLLVLVFKRGNPEGNRWGSPRKRELPFQPG